MGFTSVLLAAAAATTSAAVVKDVPIYCRLLQVSLEDAEFQPLLKDFNVSAVADASLLGKVDVSASHAEVGAVKLVGCDASVDDAGRFRVRISQMDVELKQVQWQYAQRSFPHASDYGVATGKTGISFDVSIDMATYSHEVLDLTLGEINLDLGAKNHPWLVAALEKLANFLRPLLSMAVQHTARKSLDDSLAIIRKQGGCAFLQGSLADLDFLKLQFTSYEPIETHVPVVGDVNISVNSTYIQPPTSMSCEHVGFNGTTLTAHVHDVPFSTGFQWSYLKLGSSFWHNQGTGSADVVAGTFVHINLLKPTETTIQVELPTLRLQLKPDAHDWMYSALTHAMGPLIRESLQLFGGKVATHYVEKCLEDPTCPHLKNAKAVAVPAPSSSMIIV